MANPTTASGTVSICAETNINAAYLLYLQHLANTPLLIRDINNAIINQPEPLDKLNAILEEFDDYYDYESHFDGTGNGSFKHVVVNFFDDIFNHDYGTALNAIRDNLKQYNFEATFNYIDEDYSTDYLSHETIKLMWKDQSTKIIEVSQMNDECTVDNLFELNLYGVASIENYPDLALFDSVILDSPIIEPIELLKNKHFSYNLDYHLWDFGTGEDIDLYDDTKSLSEEEWNRMFEQGIPTINTKNPIVFTADIEAIPRPVKETVEFVIPGTDRKLVIDVDSTRKNCLVDIFVSSLDEIVEDTLVHIDNFDNKDQLLTAVYLEDDDPVDIFRKEL